MIECFFLKSIVSRPRYAEHRLHRVADWDNQNTADGELHFEWLRHDGRACRDDDFVERRIFGHAFGAVAEITAHRQAQLPQ